MITAEEMAKMPRNPIYDAPLEQQLQDLETSVKIAKNFVRMELVKDCTPEYIQGEGLQKGEFAIGNWIVRPRF